MDVRAKKIWLIEQITKIKDERLIKALISLLEYASQKPEATSQQDFWDELSETQKQKIENSIRQLDDGEGIPHKIVMSEFRAKFRNTKCLPKN